MIDITETAIKRIKNIAEKEKVFSLESQLTVVDAKGSHINFHLIPKKFR